MRRTLSEHTSDITALIEGWPENSFKSLQHDLHHTQQTISLRKIRLLRSHFHPLFRRDAFLGFPGTSCSNGAFCVQAYSLIKQLEPVRNEKEADETQQKVKKKHTTQPATRRHRHRHTPNVQLPTYPYPTRNQHPHTSTRQS